jgi:anti-anti-sigma regulatory factor
MQEWYVARGVPRARIPTDVAVTPAAPGSSREGAFAVAACSDAVVVCDGEWDISRAEEFAQRVASGLARCTPVLILDFRRATFVDARIVGAICTFSREASAHGTQVGVACGEGLVRRVFELVHLADVVLVAKTPEEAMRAAAAGA